ncbi:MAG: hypothetical protein ACI8RZ_004996 [Myxococcota bacterium]|jgi:hypothetical protein
MNEFDDVVFFSPGSVIQRSLSILLGELPVFLLLTAMVYAPFIGLSVAGSMLDSSSMATSLVASGYLISLVCQPLATAALIHGVFRRLRGERASLGDSLQTMTSRLFPVIGFSLLSSLIIGIGYMLCIIPGIIMSCLMYVGLPAVVVENRGPIEAIRRSDGLTEGFRWGIFGLLFVIGLSQLVLQWGLTMALGMLDFSTLFSDVMVTVWVSQIMLYILQIATTALSGVFVAVAYHDLRVSRDGIDSGDLVSVFD